jgi:hypothetical protein
MSDYRYERGEWTDGFGETHDVVRFYVPGDDDDWLTCEMLPDGSCQRLWSRGPVYMRSAGPVYASVDAAAAEVEAAHRDWLMTDRDAWKRAIGVLKGQTA